ncbi:MAG: YkgJ family cysteine cluster protein, partial [Planctomycetota bacterium]
MMLPIRTSPLEECWDCHACSICCRGSIIPLDADERKRLREQAWHEHADFRGVRIIQRKGLLIRRYRLAKRKDGSCVFLTPEGRCRIHLEHGPEAKPLVCRMFPFQLVPLETFAFLTLRRSCPSAAADRGGPVEQQRRNVLRLAEKRPELLRAVRPPPIAGRHQRPWNDVLRAAEAIERLMLDERYPIVRRVAHGLAFCDLLEKCRLDRLEGPQLAEL